MEADSRFVELMEQAYEEPDTLKSIDLFKQAAARAEEAGQPLLAYHARMDLIHEAVFHGHSEHAFDEFDWCLKFFDDNRAPDWDPHPLLWVYKWMVQNSLDFPSISREKIAAMLDDMERRYLEAGNNLRAVHYLRMAAGMKMGHAEEARINGEKWVDSPPDDLADCAACEQQHRVNYHIFLREDEEALAAAEPIIKGEMSCAEIPHLTLSRIMLPFMRLGRSDEAVEHHRKGHRLVAQNKDYLQSIGEHLLFLVHRGELDRGLKMFQTHVSWALETSELEGRFRFCVAAALLFEALARSDDSPRGLRVPAEFPVQADGGQYRPSVVARWLEEERDEIARLFDERNGNDYYQQRIEEARQLATVTDP